MFTRKKKQWKLVTLLLVCSLVFSSVNLSVFAKESRTLTMDVIGDGCVTLVDSDGKETEATKDSPLSKELFLDSSVQIKLKGEPIQRVQFDEVSVDGIEEGTTEIAYQYVITKDTHVTVEFSEKKIEEPSAAPNDEPLDPPSDTPSEETKELTDESLLALYHQGIYDEPSQIAYRKQRAEEKGILEHVDEDYILKESYLQKLSALDVMDQGLMIFVRILSDEAFDQIITSTQPVETPKQRRSASLYANPSTVWITNNGRVQFYDKYGYPHYQDRLSISIQMPGDSQGRSYDTFCSCIELSPPPSNTYNVQRLIKITDMGWRKVLYYGYNQPGKDSIRFENVSVNSQGHYLATAEACSLANNHQSTSFGRRFYEYVQTLKAPPSEWECYKVVTTRSDIQELSFGFMAQPRTGELKVFKSSSSPNVSNNNSEYSLQGAKYTVYKNANATGVMGTLVTDSTGHSTKSLTLSPGTYYVKETEAPKGFALSSTVYTVVVESGKTKVAYVEDAPKMAQFNVYKVSSNPSWTDGNNKYSVEGAVYGLYRNQSCTDKVAQVTIGKNGWSETISYAGGTLYAKEIKSPNSYKLNPTVYSAYARPGEQATFSVSDEPKAVQLNLQKASMKPTMTDGNNCYSLDGAIYGVYSDANCKVKVSELKTNAAGTSNTLTLRAARYWVKELTAPKGYALDPQVYEADMNAGTVKTLQVKDKPMNDPISVALKKIDADTGQPVPVGDGSLAGAEYTFKYYKGDYNASTDPSTLGKTADRTWVFATDKDGRVHFLEQYKVRGDEFYTSSKGRPTIPLGTVTIQETKAPNGYKLDSKVHVRKITSNGHLEDVNSFNEIVHKEKSVQFQIKKVQKDIGQVISDTIFKVTYPNGISKEHITDTKGLVTLKGLVPGHYKVQELGTKPGLVVNPNVYEFDVLSDGTLKPTEIYSDVLTSQNFEHHYDNANAKGYLTVYNEPVPFSIFIEKANEDGKVLEGAEFTLYRDANCQNEVAKATTNAGGHLAFNQLTYQTQYYLKETKAPQGYRIPLDEKKEVHVYPVQLTFNAQTGDVTMMVDGKSYTQNHQTGNVRFEGTLDLPAVALDVVNYKTMQLPETGSHDMPYLYVTASIGVLLSGCIALRQQAVKKLKKKK